MSDESGDAGPKPNVPYSRLYADEQRLSDQSQCALTQFEIKSVGGADPQWNDKRAQGTQARHDRRPTLFPYSHSTARRSPTRTLPVELTLHPLFQLPVATASELQPTAIYNALARARAAPATMSKFASQM